MYDKKQNLSRAGMEQTIREGGSVLHGGKLYNRVESLPTEADLAAGDADATTAALAGLDAQQKSLEDQRKKLLAAQAPQHPAESQPAERATGKHDAKK